MSAECLQFRELLASALEGGAAGPLAWHEHLLSCAPCRELLAAEEALDELLATLPEPRLPRSMVERVLRRLRAGRALDRLLELDSAVEEPRDLPQRVLAALASHRTALGAVAADAKLDALLARDSHVAQPARLTERVLAGLAAERESLRVGARRPVSAPGLTPILRALPRPHSREPRSARRAILAAAAALLLVVAGWRLITGEGAPDDAELAGLDRLSRERDTALLGDLDVLERLDLLMDPDLDLVIASELEPDTELALSFAR